VEASGVTVLETPADGAYLTDGKRLVQLIGLTFEKKYVLEDCSKPCDAKPDDNQPIVVTMDQLMRDWRVVDAA
jgi:hypothetical protein